MSTVTTTPIPIPQKAKVVSPLYYERAPKPQVVDHWHPKTKESRRINRVYVLTHGGWILDEDTSFLVDFEKIADVRLHDNDDQFVYGASPTVGNYWGGGRSHCLTLMSEFRLMTDVSSTTKPLTCGFSEHFQFVPAAKKETRSTAVWLCSANLFSKHLKKRFAELAIEIQSDPEDYSPLLTVGPIAKLTVGVVNDDVVGQFLEDVYELGKQDLEDATDRIFDHIDRLLLDSNFVQVDQILARVDVKKIPTALMRSFLTITAPAKNQLQARAELYKKIEKEMLELKGVEKTQRLIGRLA